MRGAAARARRAQANASEWASTRGQASRAQQEAKEQALHPLSHRAASSSFLGLGGIVPRGFRDHGGSNRFTALCPKGSPSQSAPLGPQEPTVPRGAPETAPASSAASSMSIASTWRGVTRGPPRSSICAAASAPGRSMGGWRRERRRRSGVEGEEMGCATRAPLIAGLRRWERGRRSGTARKYKVDDTTTRTTWGRPFTPA